MNSHDRCAFGSHVPSIAGMARVVHPTSKSALTGDLTKPCNPVLFSIRRSRPPTTPRQISGALDTVAPTALIPDSSPRADRKTHGRRTTKLRAPKRSVGRASRARLPRVLRGDSRCAATIRLELQADADSAYLGARDQRMHRRLCVWTVTSKRNAPKANTPRGMLSYQRAVSPACLNNASAYSMGMA